MTRADEYATFEAHEMPAVFLEIGRALDDVLRAERHVQHGTVELRLDLDPTSVVAIKHQYRLVKTRLLEAACTHLQFRQREGLEVRIELFDSGQEHESAPVACTATLLQIE